MSQRAKFYFVYQKWYHWEGLRNDILKVFVSVPAPASIWIWKILFWENCMIIALTVASMKQSINLEHGLPRL